MTTPSYTDPAAVAAEPYTYGIRALDNQGNAGAMANISVQALTSAAPNDPRQIGIRPTGSYWGAMGEQIDMFSGNLNYTLPLLKAMGRNGWGVGFALSYNSQMWRQDGSSTFKLGTAFGWRLLAGSVVPVWADPYTISYYVYTDSTGAEYKLDVRNGDEWSDRSAVYVRYNSASNRLRFTDGSFWAMGSVSGDQADAGTRYPTLMQDANGNQIVIRYMPAVGSSIENTSARIKEIDDVRATDQGGGVFRTYQFTYNTDPVPHLTGITNSIQTGEVYTFSYTPAQGLYSPFSPATQYGTTQFLQTMTVNGLNLSHNFEYSPAGEMTRIILPYGGNCATITRPTALPADGSCVKC